LLNKRRVILGAIVLLAAGIFTFWSIRLPRAQDVRQANLAT
jgi:hypothetical protein